MGQIPTGIRVMHAREPVDLKYSCTGGAVTAVMIYGSVYRRGRLFHKGS